MTAEESDWKTPGVPQGGEATGELSIQAGAPADLAATGAAMPARKFCNVCGFPWQPQWTACPRCAPRVALRPSLTRNEANPLTGTFCLYFVLLGISVISISAIAMDARVGDTVVAVTALFAAVILVWSAAMAPTLLPLLRLPKNPLWLAVAPLMGVGTFLVATGLINLFHRALNVAILNYSQPFTSAGFGRLVIFLCICVEPAVCEELAFRGIMFSSLRRALSGKETVLVTALMFMMLHLMPVSFPHLLLLGLILGYLRLKTDSLYPSMLVHFTHNFLCILFEWMRW